MENNVTIFTFAQLREALAPKGTKNLTFLRLNPGCAVDGKIAQTAIDEIIKFQTITKHLGDEETACMQLAKILLMDSAYLDNQKK